MHSDNFRCHEALQMEMAVVRGLRGHSLTFLSPNCNPNCKQRLRNVAKPGARKRSSLCWRDGSVSLVAGVAKETNDLVRPPHSPDFLLP